MKNISLKTVSLIFLLSFVIFGCEQPPEPYQSEEISQNQDLTEIKYKNDNKMETSCGDGICDAKEQEKTNLCLQDCQKTKEKTPVVICPADAKICPDGSAVGREGPNCEFAPCP